MDSKRQKKQKCWKITCRSLEYSDLWYPVIVLCCVTPPLPHDSVVLLTECRFVNLCFKKIVKRVNLYFRQRGLFKASAHSFKQFTSRILKLSFSLSMHLYNSDGRHAWFHLHGTSRPDRSASEATKYKMKNSLSTVGLEPSTLRFQVWCSTYWASRAWWMLSV